MLALALADCKELQLDERELKRPGPTYTVDTLEELRAELGGEISLSFCMGLDSLLGLTSWHRWDQLLKLAHLVVVTRPGWEIPREKAGAELGEVAALLRDCAGTAQHLHREPCGRLVLREQTLLPVSATNIRRLIGSGQSPQFLLPDPVWRYIQDNQLYQAVTG
jgi:nicotinate-nucleotide adenylyltransferase